MKRTTPFKSVEAFETELTEFANKFRTPLAEHSKRIADYFEISCYHFVVRYYEAMGYSVEVQNLINGKFRFKCSPLGLLPKFSYFKATKTDGKGGEVTVFIFHNATVQSAVDDNVFTTPDIVVAKMATPSYASDYYLAKKLRLSYISRENILTFCEAKHLIPFPELMVGFIGTVLELKPQCINGEVDDSDSDHLAPSLMMSGSFSKPTTRIRESYENRYFVNYFDDLFDNTKMNFLLSESHIGENATLAKKSNRKKTL